MTVFGITINRRQSFLLLADAALDRLADRAHVVSVTGRSYRLARTVDGREVPLNELTSEATS